MVCSPYAHVLGVQFAYWKSRKYRKTYRELASLGNATPATRTLKVMLVLIESGVIYMLFFVRLRTR